MTDLELAEQIVTVLGPPDSGKTNFVKKIFSLAPYRRHWIYDPLREYDGGSYNVIRPSNRRYDGGNEELNAVIDDAIMAAPETLRPRYFVVDEANRTIPNKKEPGEAVQDMIDFNTHFAPGIGFWAVARRPAQLNTDLMELYDEMFVFGLRGRNDRRTYRDMVGEELVELLDQKEKYEFVHVDGEGDCTLFEPTENLGEKVKI